MGVSNIPVRKRLGLALHRRQRDAITEQHRLTYLMWECTLRCNLACRHCGSDCRKSMAQKDMPLADFLRAVDSITPYVDPHTTTIVITGGEPLMRSDLEECGRELYRREFPWGIVSNGYALTEARFRSLMAAGMRALTVSLDGLEREHDLMRGVPESFARAMGAIRAAVALGGELNWDVVTCVTPETFGQLADIRQLLIDAGVARWRIFAIIPIGRAAADKTLQLTPAQFRGMFEFIKQTRREGRIRLDYGCEGFLGNYEADVRDTFFFCRAGISVGSVLVDGSISACPSLRSNFIQGNIYRDDFADVWQNRYMPFRNRTWARTGECDGCRHWKNCLGNGMHLRGEQGELLFCHIKRIEEGEREQK